jgi:hypoxanthine phosphoribosyltransferase
MAIIKLHDKKFETFIPYEEIDKAIEKIADNINDDFKDETPIFLVILNGSFMFAGDLMKKITIPCQISFIKLASYSGTQTTEKLQELIGLNENLEDRVIIVVEDIIDTGNTLEGVLNNLKKMKTKDVRIATLLFKPDAFKGSYKIDYTGINIPNDFIVGYGLDYDQLGRNFKDIYKITE